MCCQKISESCLICGKCDSLAHEPFVCHSLMNSFGYRSISVRNGSTMDEWDNHMRIMRNELFSMCGLLSEAEGNLKQAMERADEHVNHVSNTILGTLDDKETRSSGSGARKQEQNYIELRLEMMVVRQRLDKAMVTCQNCIVALEDDLGSISEQVLCPSTVLATHSAGATFVAQLYFACVRYLS